jgi:hypothetical protein
MIRTGVRLAVLLAVLATVLVPSPAWAAAPEFRYDVTSNAGPYREIPGVTQTFQAAAGEASYLYTRNLSVENVTSLSSGDNVGNTIAIYCRNSNGTSFTGERGAYWASNLVPPGERRVTPTLRWLFVAPAAGTYTCVGAITSYSTIIVNGRRVIMRIPAGAELVRGVYPNNRRWTLPVASERTVARGSTVTTLGTTFVPAVPSATRIAITQDTALTTCKPGSSICSGGSSNYSGTSVSTWIEAQPQTATGAACGTLRSSTAANRFISTPKHHLTATNTLYLTKADLGGCAQMRVSLKVRNVDGNPVLIHGGTSGAIARTHGVGFEYS